MGLFNQSITIHGPLYTKIEERSVTAVPVNISPKESSVTFKHSHNEGASSNILYKDTKSLLNKCTF